MIDFRLGEDTCQDSHFNSKVFSILGIGLVKILVNSVANSPCILKSSIIILLCSKIKSKEIFTLFISARAVTVWRKMALYETICIKVVTTGAGDQIWVAWFILVILLFFIFDNHTRKILYFSILVYTEFTLVLLWRKLLAYRNTLESIPGTNQITEIMACPIQGLNSCG